MIGKAITSGSGAGRAEKDQHPRWPRRSAEPTRAYRAGGFAALVPAPRRLAAQTPTEVLELAAALKTEAPGRTAAQVAVVLAAHAGWAPSPRTLQRHFAALGLNRRRPDGGAPAVFGRFEADRPNARWVGDALHGPHIGGRKAILIAFLDDHSRAVMAARWGYAENAVALRETLRDGLAARGCPAQCYVDNGSMFIDAGLRRRARYSGSSSPTPNPGNPPAGARSSDSSAPSGTSSWSRSPVALAAAGAKGPRGPAPW
jgi:putative transposase